MERKKASKSRPALKMNLKFNKKFYSSKAIKLAIKDFKKICKGRILKDDGSLLEVELEPLVENTHLKEEFSNYVLNLMKIGENK